MPTIAPSLAVTLALLASFALSSASSARAQEPDAPCTVRGKLTLPDGAPAVGATLQLRGSAGNSQLKQRYGVPADWQNPSEVTTDTTGTFEFRFVPPRAFQFNLDARLGEYPKVGWHWMNIEPGATLELGAVGFEPPCFIEGHIEDSDGELLVAGWTVRGMAQGPRNAGRRYAGASGPVDERTGTFRIGPFPPGQVQLSARSTIDARVEDQSAEARPGAPAQVVLKYTGPKLSTRIVFTTFCRPYLFDLAGKFADDGPSSLVLLDADGAVLQHASHVPGTSQSWEFKDVARGSYAVELRDPRFEPKRLENIVPGQGYRLDLVGSASLALQVFDEVGEPLDAYGLWVGYRGVPFQPSEFEVRRDGTPAPADGVITGVVPGDLLVEVRGPGGIRVRQTVGPVAAGERKAVRLTLTAGKPLRGRVVRADGTPAANVRVEYTRGPYPGHANPGATSSIGTEDGKVIHVQAYEGEVLTDAQGAFEVARLEAGQWTCCAELSPYAWVAATVDHGGEAAAPLLLTLPEVGEVGVKLLVPDGVDRTRLSVRLLTQDRDPVRSLRSVHRVKPAPLPLDGQIRFTDVPRGELWLDVNWTTHDANGNGTSTTSFLRRTIEVGAEPLQLEIDVAPHLPKNGAVDRPNRAPQQLAPLR